VKRGGEKQLRRLLQLVKWAGFDVKNGVKYGACCASQPDLGYEEFLDSLGLAFVGACR